MKSENRRTGFIDVESQIVTSNVFDSHVLGVPQPAPARVKRVTRSRAVADAVRSRAGFRKRYSAAEGIEGEAGHRAVHRIVQLATAGEITDYAGRCGVSVVRFLFTARTVDSSIAPDEGGLVLLWLAGESSIEIDISASGEYWWSVRDVAGESYCDEGLELPVERLRHGLNQLSKEIERRNPRWREMRNQ